MTKNFKINSAKDLVKNKCEVDTCEETLNLHLHHIIPRTDINTNNHPMNLCILCPTHHAQVHSGDLIIIGIFPSTKLPNKRTLIYEIKGVKNLDVDHEYIKFAPKRFKI